MHITNEAAADEARRLAHGYYRTTLRAFAALPEGVALSELLADVYVRMSAEDTLEESVELVTEMRKGPNESAGPVHEQAVQVLTTTRTKSLGDGLTARAVSEQRAAVLDDLTARSNRLRRPLGVLGHLPVMADRRRDQLDALRDGALATLDGVPLRRRGRSFPPLPLENVITTVVDAASLDPSELSDIRQRAETAHCQHMELLESVLMLCWEAIAPENDVPQAELSLNAAHRLARYRAAKAKARQAEAKAEQLWKARAAQYRAGQAEWRPPTLPYEEPEADDDLELGG